MVVTVGRWQKYLSSFDLEKSTPKLPKMTTEKENFFILLCLGQLLFDFVDLGSELRDGNKQVFCRRQHLLAVFRQ